MILLLFILLDAITPNEIVVQSYTTSEIRILWDENTNQANPIYLVYYWPADGARPNTRNDFVTGDSNLEYAEYQISGLTPGRLYNIEVAVGGNTVTPDNNFAVRTGSQRTSKKYFCDFFLLITIKYCFIKQNSIYHEIFFQIQLDPMYVL